MLVIIICDYYYFFLLISVVFSSRAKSPVQDVSWFDLKEVAALPSEINDDLEHPG